MNYGNALDQLMNEGVIQTGWSCGHTFESIVCPTPLTEDQVNQAYVRWQQSNDYKIKRRKEYPSIADQLMMQYNDKMNGTTTWQDTITAVNNKYPKPA